MVEFLTVVCISATRLACVSTCACKLLVRAIALLASVIAKSAATYPADISLSTVGSELGDKINTIRKMWYSLNNHNKTFNFSLFNLTAMEKKHCFCVLILVVKQEFKCI